METTTQIVILASPGMGHLIPLIELARRLALSHEGLSVAIVTVSTDDQPPSSSSSATISLPKPITHIPLPPVATHDFPQDSKIETRISLTIKLSLPHLRRVFETLLAGSRRIATLVVDVFGSDAYDVAAEFDVPTFLFITSTFTFLSLCFHLPELDSIFSCEFRDLPEPIRAPGCLPLRGEDIPDPFQDRSNEAYAWVLHHCKRHHKLPKGIMGNSFLELEPRVIKVLQEENFQCPPIYPVGPIVRSTSSRSDDDHLCLKWLDEQPRGSVLFVCFGSGGTLRAEQLRELAWGLEMSEQRFLWVARSPDEKEAGGKFFSVEGAEQDKKEETFLPEGFKQRTQGLGLVVDSWAPQLQVLSHESTDGFLSHCGWNSTLESIVHGVPMIAWPLYAEQKMNALMLVDDLKVALRVSPDPNHVIIRREEIANVVRCLMQGEEGKWARKRMRELRDAGHEALQKDKGSSHRDLAELVGTWKQSSPSSL